MIFADQEFDRLTCLIQELWSADTEDCEGYARIIMTNIKKGEREESVRKNVFFSRCNNVSNYDELAKALFDDKLDWGIDQCEADHYIRNLNNAFDEGTHEAFLRKEGWRIDTKSRVALGIISDALKRLPELRYHLIRFEVIIGEYSVTLTRVIPMHEEDSNEVAHDYLMEYWGAENTACEEKNKLYFAWSDEVALKQLAAHTITKKEYEVLNKYLY